MRIVMYHNDADGRCAAAIVGKWSAEHNEPVTYVPAGYDDKFDWQVFEAFEFDTDEFYLLDFSLAEEIMQKIAADVVGRHFIWIDHHVTAIAALGTQFAGLPGLRDPAVAACLLTWAYCFPDIPTWCMPYAVKLIADRDIWKFAFGDETRNFYEAYLAEENKHPTAACWRRWLKPESVPYEELKKGAVLRGARINGLKAAAKRFGWAELIECNEGDRAPHSMLTVNYPASGDMGEVIKEMGFAIAHCYTEQKKDGRMVRTHTLYSETVDVSKIAVLNGGGGHKGAAGWTEEVYSSKVPA